MCGFVGFNAPQTDPDTAIETANRMLLAVAHRGPEGLTTVAWNGVVLGHCRLSFTDLVLGQQPMISPSRRFAIVFNGEIYNYRALRRMLGAQGVKFQTRSDTEVVLAMYERYGFDSLNQLRGMFALAVCDSQRAELILARDPFGKKPLYYFEGPDGVVFASELHALLRHPACPASVDRRALADYLMLRVCPAPESIIEGIRKVPAGGAVRFRKCQSEVSQGWMPSPLGQQKERGQLAREACSPHERSALTNRFGKLLRLAVVRRLATTDVEFGVLLSGGIDSAMIAALAVRQTSRRLKTFSIGFEDDPVHDETPFARLISNHLGTDHHAIRLPAAGLADIVARIYGQLDEPIADPSFLPSYLVCAEARRHVRGVLTGDGADELLLGYRFFQVERALDVMQRITPGMAVLLKHLAPSRKSASANHPARHAFALLARGLEADTEYRFYAGHAPFAPEDLKNVLSADVWHGLSDYVPFRHLRQFFSGRDQCGALERAQLSVMFHFLRDMILTKVDRASMQHALEVRCPFLDHDLVDFVGDLPLSLKLRGLTSKYILRELASRYLPRSIVRRTKQGFRTPIRSLLLRELSDLAQDVLSPAELDKQRLFNSGYVQRLLKEHLGRRYDHSAQLWTLLCFQIWWRAQMSGASVA